MELKFEQIIPVGENDYGYTFAVGVLSGRFVGFALGTYTEKGEEKKLLTCLPGMVENYELGLTDRERAIKLTGACALDSSQGYGGIDRWLVEESLRGRPADFRCRHCESVGCRGECDDDVFFS